MTQAHSRLLWLLVANVAATILHYVDNILFFPEYPEPDWINTQLIDAFWFVMTPLGVIGCLLVRDGRVHLGCAALYLYSVMSLLALGHYQFAPFTSISLRIHLFILLEATLAVVLAIATAHLQIKSTSPYRGPGR